MSVSADIRGRLDRIMARNAALHAFIRVDEATALSGAEAADRRRTDGSRLGPLDGLAVAVKDNLAVGGTPCTAGLAGRAGALAERDAHVVARLRAAGVVLLGGTNLHEAALGATTDNDAYGQCQNPIAPGFTPGGSSGGSAAAVAAGLVDLALGTDTMGSVRLPAAYCGIFGLKPTPGLIGRTGLVYLSPTLDTIGPLTRDPDLLWPAVKVLAGTDPGDPDSLPAPPSWQSRPDRADLHGLCFGVPAQLAGVDCEAPILSGLRKAREALGELGANVVDLDVSGWQPQAARRAGLCLVEAEAAVELAEFLDRPDAMTVGLRALLSYGRDLPAGKLVAALTMIRATRAAGLRALAEVDAILLPVAPQRAFAHSAPVPGNQADLTALANVAGCPSVAIPVAGDGLPAAVQIIGRPWSEATLTRWAEMLLPLAQAGRIGAAAPSAPRSSGG